MKIHGWLVLEIANQLSEKVFESIESFIKSYFRFYCMRIHESEKTGKCIFQLLILSSFLLDEDFRIECRIYLYGILS